MLRTVCYVNRYGGTLRITPAVSWSFNLAGLPFTHDREITVRRTVHRPAAGRDGQPVPDDQGEVT